MFDADLNCIIIAIPKQDFYKFIEEAASKAPGYIDKSRVEWVGRNIATWKEPVNVGTGDTQWFDHLVTTGNKRIAIAHIGSTTTHDAIAVISPIHVEAASFSFLLSRLGNPGSDPQASKPADSKSHLARAAAAITKAIVGTPAHRFNDPRVRFVIQPSFLEGSAGTTSHFSHSGITMQIYPNLQTTLQGAVETPPKDIAAALSHMFQSLKGLCVIEPTPSAPAAPAAGVTKTFKPAFQ